MYIETYNDNKFNMLNGPRVVFYNFSDTEQTFTIEGAPSWLKVPAPFKVPARNQGTAGLTAVTFEWTAIDPGGTQSNRNYEYKKNLIINTTSGDNLEFKAIYWKEVKRKDTWGVVGSTQVTVGQDLTGG